MESINKISNGQKITFLAYTQREPRYCKCQIKLKKYLGIKIGLSIHKKKFVYGEKAKTILS